MVEQPDFIRRQYELAAHIRDPARQPRPADVEDRRMAIYRDLFYRNIESLLAANFPVLRGLLSDEHWNALVREFFATHRCTTPLFPEIGQELIDYLQNEHAAEPRDPPFLLELAHYEWVELALSISNESPDIGNTDPNGDLMRGVPYVSPLAWNLSYRFPVHRIGPDFRPDRPGEQPTCLVAYRNRQDQVEFLETNPVTHRLLQLLGEQPRWTGHQAVERIAEELRHPHPEQVIESGRQLLYDLRSRDIILGTRHTAR